MLPLPRASAELRRHVSRSGLSWAFRDVQKADALLPRYPPEEMEAVQVSDHANNARNDDPQCLRTVFSSTPTNRAIPLSGGRPTCFRSAWYSRASTRRLTCLLR